MHRTVTNRVRESVFALSLVVALVCGVCLSALAQSNPTDPSFITPNSGAQMASVSGPNLASPSSSAAKSAAGLSSLPAGAQSPISAALGKNDSGYWVHPRAAAFRGENPRHALQAEFTKQGAEISRKDRSHNLRCALETRAYGYGNALHPVKPVAPQANANRVEYRRDGITEWYENGPLGLEQGFTLSHRPGKAPQKGNDQPLTLELRLRGDLVPALDANSKALELKSSDGKAALRYTGLQARDAAGRELHSWLDLRGDRLLVRVEDEAAQYPLVVDPWIQQAELTASDGVAWDQFGNSVAISGSTLVVGAYCHPASTSNNETVCGPGAAYVFVESGTTWSQQAELTASDGAAGNQFGFSVAVSGGTAVVGARAHTVGSNSAQGAAYVFVQSGTAWSQQAELTSSDGTGGDQFGTAVAVSGSTVVVGAPVRGPDIGAAYVFVQNGATWSQQAELTDADGGLFGASVAVDGGTAVVGAPWLGPDEQGAAYVFVQSGTTWSQQAELLASDGAVVDNFGASVAVSGGTVVAGAPNHNSSQGAAYVFVQSGTTWSQQAELTASDGTGGDQFGSSVAISGSTTVVGSPLHFFWFRSGPGAAYVFAESGGTWSQQAEPIAFDGAQGDQFGASVAISDSTLVAGAPNHTVGSNQDQGAAYVFASSGPLYTLSAAPGSVIVANGGQATSEITITPFNGFSGSVSLSASGLPSGVTATFNPNPATSTSTLTLTASQSAPMGTTTSMLIGTSGNLLQTTALPVTVPTTVTLSKTSLSFGDEAVDTTSEVKTVSLANTGSATLAITGITITLGTNFTIFNSTCRSTLAAGKTCKVNVRFTPTQIGALTDTLSFTDNGVGSPQTVLLSGTGVAQATLTPSSYTFPKRKVGTTSAAKKFTLKNNLPTTLTGISYSASAPFAVSASTCGAALDSGKSCTISVTFSPASEETFTGTLTVTDSANNSPQTSSLTGTGD